LIRRGRVQKLRADTFDEAANAIAAVYRGGEVNAEYEFDFLAEKTRRERCEAERSRLRYV
jgi:hypothetical protein